MSLFGNQFLDVRERINFFVYMNWKETKYSVCCLYHYFQVSDKSCDLHMNKKTEYSLWWSNFLLSE